MEMHASLEADFFFSKKVFRKRYVILNSMIYSICIISLHFFPTRLLKVADTMGPSGLVSKMHIELHNYKHSDLYR